MKVGIIGSGIAGLASAIRMAVRGYEVHVFEVNSYPGGKLCEIQVGDYRFDAGPSLFTMPEYFEELFALAGKNFTDYCPYRRLDTITHYFYSDGTKFKTFADVEQSAQEMQEKLGINKEVVIAHLNRSKKIFDLTSDTFLHRSIHTFQNISALDLLRLGTQIGALDLFSTMHETNEKKLKNEKAVQYFDRFATYNGSNPYEAPGTLNIIPHLEHHIGAFFPEGGMVALSRSCWQLAVELGVHFHFNTRVKEIVVEKNKVAGIRYNNVERVNNKHTDISQVEFMPVDLVISNMDVAYTYRQLMPNQKHPEKTLNQPRALSAMVFYLGIKKEFSELGLHNIFFSRNYKEEFDAFFQRQTMNDDLTVYVNISSKYVKSDAPEGCENWFVMVNTPPQNGQDWDSLIAATRKNVLKKLSLTLGEDIESLIEVEDILEPRIIETRNLSWQGSLYGNSSNNKFAAFLRHANFSNTIKGVYFCGGSVHPGGGIPLCVLSAKIVDELIPAQ
ncbi:MAG: phytoene desaturase [Sphingobacteriales bacterium]|jgi:phytoene desaturase|nr:phytoene desaturase [Sphingobacteriales bacterium]